MNRLPILLALFVGASASAVPASFSHQGRLLDELGIPLEGEHTLDFALYDEASAGNVLWSESLTVELENGYFATPLGSDTNPISSEVVADGEVYVELAVDGGAPLPARHQLHSVPYALVSNSAIGGVVDVTEVRVNGTTVIDGDGAISAVVDWSSVENTPDVLGDLACSDGDHPVFSGGLWACGGPSAHVHDASDINTGTIDIARLPVGTSTDSVAAGDHTHPEYVVDGTDFATSNQGCGDGEKVVGIDASGALQCAADIDTDTDTTYDGTAFATSNQGCDSDEKVVGIDASGAVLCAADIDTNTNTTYDGTDFALSGKTCPANQVVTGISSSGNPICGGFSTYRQNCSGAGCTTPACASGDILLGCTFYSDPGTDSDDMDFSPNYSNRTCSKGSNDPAYGLSAMCMRIP